MQFAVLRDAFDGLDIFALRFDGQHSATVDNLAVHDDGAGAAGGPITDLLCAGVVEAVAQRVDERDAGLEVQVVWFAVDLERHRHRSRTGHASSRGRMPGGFQTAASHRARADPNATHETAAGESAPRLFAGARVFPGTHPAPSCRAARCWGWITRFCVNELTI